MSFKEFISLSFYDAIITIQRKLGFDFEEDAHVQFLNEELLGFLFSSDGNEKQFLDYWDNNQDKLNVVMSGAINAIQILTIHKAKGLEFPVVIYPFADSTSHKPNTKKVWLPYCWRGEEIELLIPYSKNIVKNGKTGLNLFNRIKREEELDNINTNGDIIKSPMVGTAYLSPEPKAKTFIKKGDKVNKGQTLLIIEAMKVMNNINAPKDGIIVDVLIEDSQPVEYDQPIIIIK